MADLLALSSKIIDSGVLDQPANRIINEISELDDRLAIVESFSHAVTWDSDEGLVIFDTGTFDNGQHVADQIRGWSKSSLNAIVYTHGHVDHVGGSGPIAATLGTPGERVRVIGHENVTRRFKRYRDTNGYNVVINARQFGGVRSEHGYGLVSDASQTGKKRPTFLDDSVLEVTESLGDFTAMTFGDEVVEFHHARGETDDHLWAWFPGKKWLASGDFLIWNFPNAGNPQKVQRWPIEWAAALRRMIAQGPELLLPAHGLPIAGKDRIAMVLDDIATALENLVRDVLTMMNAGETLDSIIHTVKVPEKTLGKPYLLPMYDEPEFIVHNVWRQFGGWWDGAASRLKPAPDAAVGAEVAHLAGGPMVLVNRAKHLADSGEMRLACHLADFAGWAAPDDPEVHAIRAEIYERRRKQELSIMSKGIFKAASRESEMVIRRSQEQGR
jgi:alkyl sulfatase BDS1-like metallo-beta-lactamase superfamily hydrolase